MASSFSMKLKGGRPKIGAAAKAVFERELKLQDAGQVVVKTAKQFTPVVTGNLKGRWGTQAGTHWQGNTILISVVNTAAYANRVNRVGRSAGYADRGLEAGRQAAEAAVRANVGHVVRNLWDKDGR